MDTNGFLIKLSESKRTDFGKVDFAQQSDPQKVFSAIWELENNVNNGGFDLYFRNCETAEIEYATTALRSIGARECAEIVAQAIEVVTPMPQTRDEREVALDELPEAARNELESLTSRFFEYPDDLTALLFAHVSEHPEAFGPVPVAD
ncbi:MAG: DMP19 family protein [Planctomycetota bacterium]|nr:DMP19 family protein [Planctomycetota bacterium]